MIRVAGACVRGSVVARRAALSDVAQRRDVVSALCRGRTCSLLPGNSSASHSFSCFLFFLSFCGSMTRFLSRRLLRSLLVWSDLCEQGLFSDGDFGCSACPPTWLLYTVLAVLALSFLGFLAYQLMRTPSASSDLSTASKIIFSGLLSAYF